MKHETLDNLSALQKIILVISVAVIGIGASGMFISMRYMATGGLIATAVISTVHTM